MRASRLTQRTAADNDGVPLGLRANALVLTIQKEGSESNHSALTFHGQVGYVF
jgi:hypothetical protein